MCIKNAERLLAKMRRTIHNVNGLMLNGFVKDLREIKVPNYRLMSLYGILDSGGAEPLKLKIVGSGGMSIISSSFCKCKICQEARQKGGRYERLGPSLYIDDIKMLIDTPEEIAVACNRQNITEVKHLSISHSDPDHVKGMRIVEKIGYDFIQEKSMPIGFYALPEVIEDINRV